MASTAGSKGGVVEELQEVEEQDSQEK